MHAELFLTFWGLQATSQQPSLQLTPDSHMYQTPFSIFINSEMYIHLYGQKNYSLPIPTHTIGTCFHLLKLIKDPITKQFNTEMIEGGPLALGALNVMASFRAVVVLAAIKS